MSACAFLSASIFPLTAVFIVILAAAVGFLIAKSIYDY
jgi:hypothetical protein